MREKMRNFWGKNWRKVAASFFAAIMIFQVMSGALDVAAYEMGKVNLADTKGKYYDQNLCSSSLSLNKETKNQSKTSVLQKEPNLDIDDNEYDPSLEVIKKRTSSSKTYKLSDGSYVTDTYFEPVHRKEGKEYVDIDNTLSNTSKLRSNPVYENKNGLYSFKVQDQTMSITNEQEQTLSVVNDSASLNTYNVKENIILYSEAYNNIDMEYRLHGNSVSTNFFVNGTTTTKEITFSINKGNLKVKEEVDVLTFLDNKDNVVYTYTKPIMYDGKGEVRATTFSFKEDSDKVNISMVFDTEWINSTDRIYPIQMSTRAADANTEIDVDTAYNRSLEPNTTSGYYDLFVGYEDGQISGLGYPIGITRTYINVKGMNLGADKLILGAKLKLYKKIGSPAQWGTIEIGKTNGYVKPSDATWNNRPAVSYVSTTDTGKSVGWKEFDVKSYIEDIYKGKNNTIELKTTNESDAYKPNVFSSESGTGMPKISVSYRDAFDVNPNLPIDTFDTEMRLFGVLDKGFEAFSFDGIARPDSQVIFDLVERGKDDVVKSVTSKGNVNKYFIDPIYITNHIANTQTYKKDDVNYTTDYVFKDAIPEFDKPYEYKVIVKSSNSTSTTNFRTDSFIKYKVKSGDNLQNLASYYGITIDEIKSDNNLKNTNIIKEDDVLLLRFKKDNDKVSKDVYTPPTRTIDYKAKYVNRGPRCSSGTCPIIDPVNATTGNYYYEGIDFTIKDAEDFDFNRYYNSTGPQLSNMFGNGFTTPIESYISYDKNGNILYFTGDGKIFELEKDGSGYKSRPQDKLEVSVKDEKVTLKDLDTNATYQFSVYGYLETITSKEGIITKINYDNYGLITSLNMGDKLLTFTYNDSKLVKDITLPNGNKVSYKYDKNRNLIEFIDAAGKIKKYTYDKNNYLTSIVDKNNNIVTQNTYDVEGRVTKQIDGNGNVSTITYGDKQTVIKNADGSEDIYKFNEQYDILSITQDGKVTSKNTYDSYRNITSITDEDGKTTNYTYDKQNLLKAEYPDGTFEEFKYDTLGNMTYQRDREGKVTNNTYSGYDLISTKDSKNAGNSYIYDGKRRIVKETDQFGASKEYTYNGNMIATISYSNGLIEAFEYDTNGNTTKESDNQGKITTYVYNANNQMIQKNYYDGTNEQWTYDDNGNIASYKDRIGGASINSYDKNNNLLKSQKGNMTTSKTYNEINQITSETDEKGLIKSYTYDVYGNKATETDGYGNKTSYQYDPEGKVLKTTDSFGNSEVNEYKDGNLIKSTSKDGLITTYRYDSLNREIEKTNPNGTIETKEYSGLLLKSETDGKGTIIEHFYDAYDREIKTITAYTDGVVSVSQNTYDMYGNIIETNVDGVITKNTYDVYKQLLSTTDALGNTTKKEYDLDGNLIKDIDALGNAVVTEYDGNKNVISITDKNGNVDTKTYNVLGQLISEKDALGFVKTYKYNNKGLMIEAVDPYNRVVTYQYDQYGNQVERVLEGKTIAKKEFDTHGREIYNETLEEKVTTKYDDFDRVIEKTNELTGLTTNSKYDKYGNIIEENDSEGLTTTNEYDKFNRKIKSIDAYGREETYSYDMRDKILKTNTFDGTITSSVYDDRGNVIESIDAYGKVTKNTYNILNQLIKEESGQKITENIYGANGQVIEVKNINKNTSTKTIYDKNGNVVEQIDALGNSTKTEYDAKNQTISSTDANGNKSTKTYDGYGNIIKETDALGFSKQTKFNEYGLKEMEVDERGFEVKYEYDDNLLLSKVTDSKGYTLKVEYNDKRQLVKETNANDGVTEHVYDTYGREIKTVDPNGKTTSKEFDVLGNLSKETVGKKETINTYDELGRVTETKINNVIQTKNVYNELNQIIKSFDANNNVSTYKYDINNQVVYSNEKGSISEKEYDIDGNIIKQIDNTTLIAENSYDALNKILETKVNGKITLQKVYDPNGNEIVSIENGMEIRKTYNATNKILTAEVPSATKADEFVAIQTIEYDESGNPLKITDANGKVEEKKYDANNNVIEEISKNGIKTLYEYDGLNNVIKVQNHEDRYVSYTYDKVNNVTIKNINNKYAEFKYDENNNLLSEENENGYKTTYSYDELGRKIKQTNPDGRSIDFAYDNLGNKLSENKNTFTYDERGNILTSTNKEGTVKNTYDVFNNKTSVVDTKGKQVSYTFNNDNKLSEKDYAGVKATYTYNDNGMLETVKKNNQLIAKYEYNARNEVVQLTQGQTITKKSYNDMGLVLTQNTIKDNKVVFDAAYTYDGNDNVIKEIVDGKTNTYEYDGYDELIKSHKYIKDKYIDTSYKQDVFGNQIESNSNDGKKVYKYNGKNQIQSIDTNKGIIKYSYDDNGNVSTKINEDGRVDNYTYDDLGQLTKLEQGQYTYDYKYDAEKERISQKWTDTKDYHYDQWYNYTEPLDVVGDSEIDDTFKNLKEQSKKKQDNGNTCTSVLSDKYDVTYFIEPEVTEYTLDRNQEYTQVLKANDSINIYGNTLLQTNDESIVTGLNESVVAKVGSSDIQKLSYNDYGATTDIKSGNGYNGETLDQTGLIYLRARYYDPSVSRFIQIDKNYDGEKESVASQNKYVYTMNNPYKYVDRNGEWSLFGAIGNVIKKVVKTVVKVVVKAVTKVVTTVVGFFSPSTAKAINKAVDNGLNRFNSFVDSVGGNSSSKKGGGSSKAKTNTIKYAKVEAKCPEKELVLNESTSEEKEINRLCDEIYKKYENKFDDSGRLKAIKGVIDDLRKEGLKNLDIEKVRETCKQYEKKLRLPSYTTDERVTYLTKSYVSLENSIISDAFVSDCSKVGSYNFTLNINEYCGSGYGIQVSVVSFSAGLPAFDEDCFNYKLSLCLDLVNISYSQEIFSFLFIEVGGFIGLGADVGFSFDLSTSEVSFVSKQGFIVGYWIKGGLDINKMIN